MFLVLSSHGSLWWSWVKPFFLLEKKTVSHHCCTSTPRWGRNIVSQHQDCLQFITDLFRDWTDGRVQTYYKYMFDIFINIYYKTYCNALENTSLYVRRILLFCCIFSPHHKCWSMKILADIKLCLWFKKVWGPRKTKQESKLNSREHILSKIYLNTDIK